jgi:hypothetical protein
MQWWQSARIGDRAGVILLDVAAIADEIGSKPTGESVLDQRVLLRGEVERAARFLGGSAKRDRRGSAASRRPSFLTAVVGKGEARAMRRVRMFEIAGSLSYEALTGHAGGWKASRDG